MAAQAFAAASADLDALFAASRKPDSTGSEMQAHLAQFLRVYGTLLDISDASPMLPTLGTIHARLHGLQMPTAPVMRRQSLTAHPQTRLEPQADGPWAQRRS